MFEPDDGTDTVTWDLSCTFAFSYPTGRAALHAGEHVGEEHAGEGHVDKVEKTDHDTAHSHDKRELLGRWVNLVRGSKCFYFTLTGEAKEHEGEAEPADDGLTPEERKLMENTPKHLRDNMFHHQEDEDHWR